MRSSRAFVLVAGLCAVLAGPARAGDFGNPLLVSVCGNSDVAFSGMADPDVFVFAATPELCDKLCDRTAKRCRVYVNDVFACHFRRIADQRAFDKLNCASALEDPAAVKACKQEAKEFAAAVTANFKGSRTDSLNDCGEWQLLCHDACSAP